MELVTFNFEVSTGEFTFVKPEPRKQVARAQKKTAVFSASYTYLYILRLCAYCDSRFGFSSSKRAQRGHHRITGIVRW